MTHSLLKWDMLPQDGVQDGVGSEGDGEGGDGGGKSEGEGFPMLFYGCLGEDMAEVRSARGRLGLGQGHIALHQCTHALPYDPSSPSSPTSPTSPTSLT